MNKKKLAALALSGVLATTMLSGCSSKNSTEEQIYAAPKTVATLEQVQLAEMQPEKKIYLPYEHVFFTRYYIAKGKYSEKILGGQIEIPAGYEILEIENFNEKYGYGSQTGGFDVWFINNEPVEASPVYDPVLKKYDYSEPGSVVDMSLQEEGPELSKTIK